jgi:hypothetical protein
VSRKDIEHPDFP